MSDSTESDSESKTKTEPASVPTPTPIPTPANINDKFNQIITDFKKDLVKTFPELEAQLEGVNENAYIHCAEMYPKIFFELLYENEELFKEPCFLLPKIDFTLLMKDTTVTDKTKKTIWKYLQLIMFSVLETLNSKESFGDTSKIFEGIKEDDLHKKIAETMDGMKDFFTDASSNADGSSNFMDPENLKTHLDGLMNGKIGSLAKEIAEEAASSIGDQAEFMKTIMQNPQKILSLVKDIGGKLEDRIKKGDVKQSELLEEATEIMEKMKDIPGLKQMMSKMGMNGNIDFKAMANKMSQNMKFEKTKERMNKKREAKISQKDDKTFVVKVDDTTQQKSQKPKKAKRNKKKKDIV